MPKELPARFGIAPHAAKKLVRRQMALGVGFSLVSVALIAVGSGVVAGIPMLCASALFFGLGLYNRSLGAAVQVVNKSFNAASFGHLKDAGELLDYAEETFRLGYIRRVIDLQRSIIAMRRGELDAALLRAAAAIVRPLGVFTRQHERLQVASAHGLRALLRAGAGDRAGAAADIEVARKSPHAVPETLARAELAEALLLERAGDMEALREHLTRERRLL